MLRLDRWWGGSTASRLHRSGLRGLEPRTSSLSVSGSWRRGVPAKRGLLAGCGWSRAGVCGGGCVARAPAGAVTGSRVAGDRPACLTKASQHAKWVLWLDNLERYLGAYGLTRTALARILDGPGYRLVLATMRAAEHARYIDPIADSEGAAGRQRPSQGPGSVLSELRQRARSETWLRFGSGSFRRASQAGIVGGAERAGRAATPRACSRHGGSPRLDASDMPTRSPARTRTCPARLASVRLPPGWPPRLWPEITAAADVLQASMRAVPCREITAVCDATRDKIVSASWPPTP